MISQRIIQGSVISQKELEQKLGRKKAKEERDRLSLFPTPFRGIYYVPFKTERDAFYITYPYRVLFSAAKKFTGDDKLYYGMETALYFSRKIWNPVSAHIFNSKKSKLIAPVRKTKSAYWRSKKRQEILSQFPYPINLHRIKPVQAKTGEILSKDGIAYSSEERTFKDANYLCKKGSKVACDFLKMNSKGEYSKRKVGKA